MQNLIKILNKVEPELLNNYSEFNMNNNWVVAKW